MCGAGKGLPPKIRGSSQTTYRMPRHFFRRQITELRGSNSAISNSISVETERNGAAVVVGTAATAYPAQDNPDPCRELETQFTVGIP